MAYIILIVTIVVMALVFVVPDVQNNIRKDRIISIANSLKLDDQKYTFQSELVRGQIMTLDWNISKNSVYIRKYTSSSDVATTLSEIKTAASNAGLIYVGDAYPSSSIHTIEFKTKSDDYVRFDVFSKLRFDELYNNPGMSQEELNELDKEANSAPTNIIISINLDGIN